MTEHTPSNERLDNALYAMQVMPTLEFAKYVAMLEETVEGLQENNARWAASHADMQAVVTAAERLLADASEVTRQRLSEYGEPYGLGTDCERELGNVGLSVVGNWAEIPPPVSLRHGENSFPANRLGGEHE